MARIGIFGAGAVGCYLGGRLATATEVPFVGRPAMRERLAQGLRLTDLQGLNITLQPNLQTDALALAECDLILVTVKSGQTEDAAKTLAPVLKPGALVVSLQNGVSNKDRLARHLPQARVIAGVVPFNLVWLSPAHLHQASAGSLMVEDHLALAPFLPAFTQAGLPVEARSDMQAVVWGKLLLNLNNAINALANIPLRDQLGNHLFRECLALAMAEALALLQVEGRVSPARLTPVPNSLIPTVLRLPDWLFRRAARGMLDIDDKARSSMSDDLAAGRPTEIDWLNKEIVVLGDRLGIPTPINLRLYQLIRDASVAPTRPTWDAKDLLAELRVSRYVPTA